jgi:hypothetical protein
MAGRTITHLDGGDREPGWSTVLTLCRALGVEVGAFAKEPAARPAARRGRPPKAKLTEAPVKRPRGRPPKAK